MLLGMSLCRQTFRERIRNHQTGAKGDEFKHIMYNQITDEIAANIKMTRVPASNGVFRHSHQ